MYLSGPARRTKSSACWRQAFQLDSSLSKHKLRSGMNWILFFVFGSMLNVHASGEDVVSSSNMMLNQNSIHESSLRSLNQSARKLATCSAEEQTDYTGNDICFDPSCPRSSTSAGCCNLCASTSGCGAFTWTDYAGGTCWLKSGKSGSTACSACRSAVLTSSPVPKPGKSPVKSPTRQTCSVEEQTDYTGNDICSEPSCPRSSTSAGCCNLCASTSGCGAFTWTDYAGGTCWLKSGKNGSTTCSGCRSAILTNSPISKPVAKPSKPVVKPSKPVVKPSKPVAKPIKPIAKPTKPVAKPVVKPKPASSPSSVSNCGPVIVATMTSYDNLSGDDSHPGCFNDYCGTTPAFLDSVPVVAIHQKNWPLDKYHYIEITRSSNGAVGITQSWDLCADTDCNGCCTTNAQAFGGDYLVDVERRTLQRLFGMSAWDQTFEKVTVRVCNSFDPAPIAIKYGLQ